MTNSKNSIRKEGAVKRDQKPKKMLLKDSNHQALQVMELMNLLLAEMESPSAELKQALILVRDASCKVHVTEIEKKNTVTR